MKEDEFKYNAFISYRHNDLDKYVAENLHRLIETYIMPKSVVEKYNITDNNFRRVFRDQDELPLASNLEDPIVEALKKSKFLIVICSPRLKESIWCKKEIEKFIEFHGRNNILCVLVEGEPKDSFPSILQYHTVKTKNKLGKEITKKVYCEPLAMDVRGNNKKEIYKNIKKELIRVIAPMYHLDYDDIKQRHEERKIKKKIRLFEIIAIVCILFTIYSAFLFIKIYISSEQLKYDQSINLANTSNELLLDDNRNGAIEKAYQSVTKYNNIKMPVTVKGIYELTDSLGVYYLDNYIYPRSQLDTIGVVENIKTNLEKKYLLSYDTSGELILWNLDNETKIKTISNTRQNMNEYSYTFIGNEKFAYINDNKEIVVLDLKGNEITKIKLDISPKNINSSKNGKYLEIDDSSKFHIYETDKYTELSSFEVSENMKIIDKTYFDEKEENFIFATGEKEKLYSDSIKLSTYNINQKKIINSITMIADTLKKIIFNDDNAIVLTQKSMKTNFITTNMIVIKYNYINGNIFYQKVFNKESSADIEINLEKEGNKTILVVGESLAYLLDYDTGKQKRLYSLSDTEVNILAVSEGNYAMFSANGYLYSINAGDSKYNESDNITRYSNIFNCNLNNYKEFVKTWVGYLTYTSNDNRIIIYGTLKNKDIKKVEYEKKEFNKLRLSEIKSLAEEYNHKKKNLVSNAFYSDDKKLLFIVYKDDKLEVYNTKNKELLKEIDIPKYSSFIDTYIAKTKNGEHIIKGIGGYILNKDLDLIAYVPSLYDYHDDKMILINNTKDSYYEVKIYSDKEIINKAKDYLQSIGKISK